jgi:hypothetical protein
VSSILEQAQVDLARAKREASELRRRYNAAVEKVQAEQTRVDKLLITQLELDHERAVLAERRRAAKG